jgi:hypothetical protein
MIPVMQTKRGGPGVPSHERGDCWPACLASILEVPIDEVLIPHSDTPESHWWDESQQALEPHGFEVVVTSWVCWPRGYWIASVPSKNLGCHDDGQPVMHVIVMHSHEVAHDPCLGECYSIGTAVGDLNVESAYVLVPLETRSLRKIAA